MSDKSMSELLREYRERQFQKHELRVKKVKPAESAKPAMPKKKA